MSIDSVGAAGADIASRIAAIQQMASQIGLGPNANSFSSALSSAQDTSSTTATSTGGNVNGIPYANEINAAANKYGIDPSLLAGLVKQESGFNPNATSPVGAKGLTQLMPATAKALGVTNVNDPAQALDGGAKYLKQQLDHFGGDVRKAVAAYNAGPGAVERYGGVPPYPETQNYVKNVLANRDAYAKTASPRGDLSTTATSGGATNASSVASALSAANALAGTSATTASTATNPYASSLQALSTDDSDSTSSNSSNLSLSSSSTSTDAGTSSSLGYPTT